MKNLKLTTNALNRLDEKSFNSSVKSNIYIVIDNVRSGLNIGSIFRTADAFRVNKIFLTGICPVPPHKEILKTALGSTDTVLWEYAKETADVINLMQFNHIKVYAVEQTVNSIKLEHFYTPPDMPVALVFGNEVEGVQQHIIDICNGVIEIPQFGTKHSLNVAVSAGIVIWDIAKNRLLNLVDS